MFSLKPRITGITHQTFVDPAEFVPVAKILKGDTNARIHIGLEPGGNKIFINCKHVRPELMLRFRDYEPRVIVIARIYIANEHKGIGTAVLNELEEYGVNHNYEQIQLEHTSSVAICNFAQKHGFRPIPTDSPLSPRWKDGVYYGDWFLNLR